MAKGWDCSHYRIQMDKEWDSQARLDIFNVKKNYVCSSVGLVYPAEEADLLADLIEMDGETHSSNGFDLPTYTYVNFSIDMSTGEGLLKTKSGKKPSVLFKLWEKDYMSNCRRVTDIYDAN